MPGNADASEMIRRILSDDADEQMPPPVTKKKLTDAQKKLLVDWIKSGAEYQPHWSLIAPVRPPVPEEFETDAAWVRNPIDNFVAAKLESVGLTPAPEADRRTLARRVSLDLIGLPPSPEMVEAFVKDDKPDAYERLVDKLMASPKWGEHRGRYWLDAARYGDTHGIHIDNYREIWSYRDWVIDAINKNMPFDQFTIENLAGDLLPNATLEQIASAPASTAATSRPAKAARSMKSTRCSTRAIAWRRRRKSGWASPPAAPCVTITSSIRSRKKSSTSWRRSSITQRRSRWTATSKTRRRSSWCRRRPMPPGSNN